jgi:hypothetical protein
MIAQKMGAVNYERLIIGTVTPKRERASHEQAGPPLVDA